VGERDGRVVACAPLYLKSHSYGEYVFDWSWADAYQRAGGRYYPKLQCAVPFTPVTGPRLLTRPGEERAPLVEALIAAMLELARRHEVSSLHVTFPTEEEWSQLGQAGLLQRIGHQYHWENRGYASFDDFLSHLSSRKRKDIRKEREKANAQGLTIRTLTGAEIGPGHWDAFHGFYLDTVGRKWGHAYLSRDFFRQLAATMADKCVLVVAENGGRPVAGALNLIGGDTLYGRNWGAAGDYPFLHFELCYYRAIDFAIERGLKWVEAGAQGAHKVSRGYLPRATYSAHWIADPGFREVVARFLAHEREMIEADIEETAEAGPFRKG
jgi:predicted N-acyltransferase